MDDWRLIAGVIIGYFLVCVFYLVIFYSVMMKKEVVIKGINLMEQIRRNVIIYREGKPPLDLLGHSHYTKAYVAAFVLAFIASVGFLVVTLIGDTRSEVWNVLSPLAQAMVLLFFAVNVLGLTVYTIFILNVAFHPVNTGKEVALDDGTIVSIDKIRCARSFTNYFHMFFS